MPAVSLVDLLNCKFSPKSHQTTSDVRSSAASRTSPNSHVPFRKPPLVVIAHARRLDASELRVRQRTPPIKEQTIVHREPGSAARPHMIWLFREGEDFARRSLQFGSREGWSTPSPRASASAPFSTKEYFRKIASVKSGIAGPAIVSESGMSYAGPRGDRTNIRTFLDVARSFFGKPARPSCLT